MHASRTSMSLLVVAAASLATACAKSDNANQTTQAAGDSTPAAAPAAGASAGNVNSVLHVTVTGGPNAGSYDAQATEGGCSAGLTGANSWGNQYSITATDPKQFSSLQLIVPDAKAAAAGTKDFTLTVGFGPLMSQTTYNLKPASGDGSGTLKIDDSGTSAKVTFSGQTKAGVKLDGTIDCRTVMRAG